MKKPRIHGASIRSTRRPAVSTADSPGVACAHPGPRTGNACQPTTGAGADDCFRLRRTMAPTMPRPRTMLRPVEGSGTGEASDGLPPKDDGGVVRVRDGERHQAAGVGGVAEEEGADTREPDDGGADAGPDAVGSVGQGERRERLVGAQGERRGCFQRVAQGIRDAQRAQAGEGERRVGVQGKIAGPRGLGDAPAGIALQGDPRADRVPIDAGRTVGFGEAAVGDRMDLAEARGRIACVVQAGAVLRVAPVGGAAAAGHQVGGEDRGVPGAALRPTAGRGNARVVHAASGEEGRELVPEQREACFVGPRRLGQAGHSEGQDGQRIRFQSHDDSLLIWWRCPRFEVSVDYRSHAALAETPLT
jgi:hypothetical protein